MTGKMIRTSLVRTAYHGTMTAVCAAPIIAIYVIACLAGGASMPYFFSFATVAVFWLGLCFGALFSLS